MPQAARTYDLLMIDDDAVDRQHYARLLKQQSHGLCEIREAPDAAAGLAALRACAPDCVLLDYRLPDMTGLEFLAAATENDVLPCAVVLITGHGDVAIAVTAMQHGVCEYLGKGELGDGRLWRAVTQAVAQVEQRRTLADMLEKLTTAYAALEPANAAVDQAMAALETEVAGRKQAEAALRTARDAAEAANLAKTRFLAMTTRELFMPVGVMLGQSQLLRIEGGLSTQQDGRVGAIARAAQHMMELADGVLEFASIDLGRTSLKPNAVAIRDLIKECFAAAIPIATEFGLSLHLVNAESAPHEIFADHAALRQAVVNLLGNRLKYTNGGGLEVRMLPGETPGGLRIEIADVSRGAGDPARERMVGAQLEAASLNGAGIGLAIAARIVGLMGGTIGHHTDGDTLDAGSVFWLDVPSADRTASDAARPARGRVLLVDDIEMNRDVIGGFLRAAGHEVLIAESGQEAVQMAYKKMVDVVLMDVRMPEMDGLEATRRIRALPNPGSEVPILALSAYTMRDQAAQCIDAGMDGFVAKPVGYATLIRAIDDVFMRPTVLNRALPRAS